MSKRESPLQVKLKKKIISAGISAHALEKQAGLKRSAVQNILYGKSKKPSAEILRAITKVLGCSINELLGMHDETSTPPDFSQVNPTEIDSVSLDTTLYAKAVQHANLIFRTKNIVPNKQEALVFINEIYQYSINSGNQEIDIVFAEWLANKTWPNIT